MAVAGHRFGRLVALAAILDVAACVDREREAVGLIDHGEIPFLVRLVEGFPCSLGAQEVAADDHTVELIPRVLGETGVEVRCPELHEVELEAIRQLAHPLRPEVGGRDDEDAITGSPQHEFLHIEAAHDGLARARVVGQQKAQPGLVKEAVIDRLELMGQRLDVGDRDRGHVEGESGLDAPRLDAKPELDRVAVEAQLGRPQDELDAGQL